MDHLETLTPEDKARENHESFMENYELIGRSETYNSIVGLYYAFTTLSTVGFGDYTPRGDVER